MGYGLRQIGPPVGEPISLEEAKAHLRVDHDADDTLIASQIGAAREFCETYTGRQFVTATWRLTLDCFPYGGVSECGFGDVIRLPKPPLQEVTSIQYVDSAGVQQTLDPSTYQVDAEDEPARIRPAYGQYWPVIRIQMAPVQVTYVAGYGPVTKLTDGVSGTGEQTVTPSSITGIYVDTQLAVDVGTAREVVRVTAVDDTTFTATFNSAHGADTPAAGAIPNAVRLAMLLLLSDWYENRENSISSGAVPQSMPIAVKALLDSKWTGEL